MQPRNSSTQIAFERRAEPRLADAGTVLVRWYDGTVHREYPGRVSDISTLGISIHIEQAIPIGTAVRISDQRFGDCWVFGIIRHKTAQASGPSFGIEFVDDIVNLHVQLEVQSHGTPYAETQEELASSLVGDERL